VGTSAALPDRGVVPLTRFGRELVLWRDAAGTAHLFDAHCRHQGAHLGHGGVVLDELLKCPFHGWRWGADGRCRAVPGARSPPEHEPLGVWPLLEREDGLLAWHDPRDGASRAPSPAPPRAPSPAPPEVPEFAQAGWRRVDERAWTVRSHVFEVIENLVDAAHFVGLHKTPQLPRTTFEADGERAIVRSAFALDSLAGPVPTTLVSEGHGPGHWVLRFTGIVPAVVITTATPIDAERLEFRLLYLVQGDEVLGRAFADSVNLEVEQDRVVWEHKVWRANPPLSEADGPIAAYRGWCEQFDV
jgi:nitrite reductase/ring-hydroxylating ferredoxin subunit